MVFVKSLLNGETNMFERNRLAAVRRIALLGAASAFGLAHSAMASTTNVACGSLSAASVTLDGVASVVSFSAIDIPAMAIDGVNLPNFCYVSMVVSSNAHPGESQIQIVVGLPEGGTWNGRFVGTGNGGFAGSVSLPSAALYVAQGYSAANTDLGTGILFKCSTLYCGSQEGTQQNPAVPLGGLYKDPPAIRDFGYGATHLMTLAGQQLTAAFYSQKPVYSYFHGCSTGGQQALMEAQRYPNDYNGILAGSPAYNRTHLHIASAALYEQTHFTGLPGGLITAAAASLVHTSMLASCAGQDGGLATDNFLTKPASCSYDATALECTGANTDVPCTDPTATSCTCLTSQQALAMDADWTGAKDNDGRVLFPGYERGVEDPNTASDAGLLAQEAVTEPLFDSLDYWAFGPTFTWQKLFASTSAPEGELTHRILQLDGANAGGMTFADALNANNANLSSFGNAGHRLLMYAGYEDPLIPSASSIDYANQVRQDDPKGFKTYFELFMAPGMWHCSGGPGANAFGNLGSTFPPTVGDPSDDIFAALREWVENSTPPSTILATKFNNDTPSDGIAFQRPLCPYPQNAAYSGSGDPTQATNWKCTNAPEVKNQAFAPVWGPK